MPNGLIAEDSLRPHPDGLALKLTIPWYRSLWLSSVSTLRLTVDGAEIPVEDLFFELGGTRYAISELPEQSETLWFLQQHPLLVARLDQPVALGEQHEVEIFGELRLPYMQIAPGQDGGPGMYVPNIVRQTFGLTVTDEDAPPLATASDVAPPPPAAEDDPFKLGLTLYSASAEFRAGWYDFDGLLDRVAELGIGPGIEIVASQVLPTYPVVSDEFVTQWRAAFDKHGFDESSFGANLDMGRRRDRDMTPDEEFEFSELLFQGAKKLGFPLVRIQSAKPELLRRLLPVAESLELKLAYEIHAPMGPNAPEILKVRDVYAELDSPLLGFVADFSSTMHAMSPTLLRAVRRAGLDDEATLRLQQIWATDASMRERQQEFIAFLQGRDFDPGRLGSFAHLAFNMHGHVDPREWADIMPQILHVHAKFYDIDENGQEPAIDYPELVRVFVEGGYRGYWSSEWEGHAFAELGEVDPLLLVRKQHDLIRRSMHAAADAMSDTEVDFRTLPLPEVLRLFREKGEPADPRPDIDTASLKRRFPHLVNVETRDIAIEGAVRAVPARLYRDASAEASGRALVWVHGGAFIGGNLDMPESNWVALEVAARGIPVLAVDYVKCRGDVHFPEPSDDVLAAWRYAIAHAGELFGVDAPSVLLGGASAGGNLTAGITARLRDADEPVPAGLVLVYPVLHPNGPEASGELDLDSPHGELARNFAGSAEALAHPHAFAALGPAEGFPPTFVLVCEHDELRPSGEAFARQLDAAGVDVELRLEAGAAHGHINEPADPTALPTIAAVASWIDGAE